MNLFEVAHEIARRIIRIPAGPVPAPAWEPATRPDGPIVAKLIEVFGRMDPQQLLIEGRRGAFKTDRPAKHELELATFPAPPAGFPLAPCGIKSQQRASRTRSSQEPV